jgi:twitching motility protein PilT
MAAKETVQLQSYLQEAHQRGASDLFLVPGEPASYRVNGAIVRAEADPLTAEAVTAIAEGAIGPQRLAEIGPSTARVVTSCSLPGVVDGRMCVARTLGEPSIVVRLLPSKITPVGAIGMPAAAIEMLKSPSGLIIASGVAGSGKTTVLLSMIDHINVTRAGHICTVENPLTMRLVPKRCIIQQREVGVDVPDVLGGLKAALLQDPDVILVGETKRVEELEACITMAETGHLVLLQMFGRTPQETIQRLIDVQPPELRGAFQRALARMLRMVVTTFLLNSPTKGKEAAWGVLIPDVQMQNAIAEGKSVLDRPAPAAGCQLLEEDIRRLAREGKVTQDEAQRALAAIGQA